VSAWDGVSVAAGTSSVGSASVDASVSLDVSVPAVEVLVAFFFFFCIWATCKQRD
jgi:hypothetical protein